MYQNIKICKYGNIQTYRQENNNCEKCKRVCRVIYIYIYIYINYKVTCNRNVNKETNIPK